MKTNQEKLKVEFMAEAELLFDQLMKWDEETSEPNMTQIENIILKIRQQLGEKMAQSLLVRQEKRQPTEKMICPNCRSELENKGQKKNRIESQIGSIQLERSYYYCPECRKGFFPPG